ncbi:SDR family oxidoreductase [Gracilimonas mengyeensis]|uniref:NADP-dependent 3-hydroxy acid dehydrogenase YdfG n=1 Tax=Gracilimonas mengyeensis TaxID=1302730 RepID=A0A521E0L8_9BACT|nr:SDR family oxidoreductase [Gracilimonas mengyeensis]SMO77422.1 NADP-dependent 3-hydroxy acid dehydrogenase YdfG [Gracilimonas mengyeensis]
MNLDSKIAIVTGASSGIGAEFSRMLVKNGSEVYGLARSKDKLQELQKELGDAFHPVTMDVTEADKLEKWVDQTFGRKHQPDILINNAGIMRSANVEDLSLDEWHNMINVNLNGIFYLTRLIVPLMKANKNTCHIINIASIAGLLGNPTISGYNASKFGVRGFSEALFKELRYDAIKVTCVFPGSIDTELFSKIEGIENHPNMMKTTDISSTVKFLLETDDNYLINEITMRPLNPKNPNEKE